MTLRSISLAAVAVSGGALGCFTGADALGLPCDNAAQCGRGQECIDGYCGGTAKEGLCGNGVLDPGEECDDGTEKNAAEADCTPVCTVHACGDEYRHESEACDDGDLMNGDGCSSECELESCGNGVKEPGEFCDPAGVDEVDCDADCTEPSCGDAHANGAAGEDCDPGEETAECDADCSEPACGDEHVNAAAGEECDNDADAADDFECMSNCTVPLLWDDLEEGTPPVAWSTEKVSGGDAVTDTWSVTPQHAASGMKAWDSGPPSVAAMMMAAGEIRLRSPAIDLSPHEGETVMLRFATSWDFLDCDDPAAAFEGAVVEVAVDGGDFTVLQPINGYPGTIGDGVQVGECNPAGGQAAFVLAEMDFTTFEVDLSPFTGGEVEVGFRAIWDCGSCLMAPDADLGWWIDDIVVWRP